MNETLLVFGAEFSRRIRSRPFLIATALGVFAIALFVESPSLIERATSASGAVVLAGPPALRAPAAALLEPDYRVTAEVNALPRHVTAAYLDAHGHASAALALSQKSGRLHVDVYPRDLAAFADTTFQSLGPLGVQLATGLPLASARRLNTVGLTLHPLDERFSSSKDAALAHAAALGLVFILYLSIIIASQSVMASVAEEKTSRIAELLVATISPISLLTGKTLAAATLALAQIIVWVSTAVILFPSSVGSLGAATKAAPPDTFPVSPDVLVAFVVFFVIGFIQYATIYAAAASLISRTEDLGSVSMPVVLPVVAAFLLAQFAAISPNAPLAVATSFIPFFSPFVIFTRIAVSSVPQWQVVLAVAINALAAVACFYVAGKIYRVGMLLYGKLPSLRQVGAALRA